MITHICDGCGRTIPRDSLRYTVKIDVRAAYEETEIGLSELVRDHRDEMLKLIKQLEDQSAEDIEQTVYKGIKLDLCPACQQAFVKSPLKFHPEQGAQSPIDIDSFLRSLGYGRTREGGES